MSTRGSVFDRGHLPRSLELDDRDVLADFYTTFLQQLEEFLQHAEASAPAMGLEEQRHHAHKLGSSCRTVGAPALATLLEELENLCRNAADVDTRNRLLAEIARLAADTHHEVALHLSLTGND
jgi:HPt (histidine-containing phosphotransfer) domain-containing protein